MHWAWKNCPEGWAGQFEGKEKTPTIILEAVASKSLRIVKIGFIHGVKSNIDIIISRSGHTFLLMLFFFMPTHMLMMFPSYTDLILYLAVFPSSEQREKL